ncbi:LysR family transcriptional regulator [Ascidiaceihabitans sp.]|uniref:LysR family transcriptional regulator n=1 Tax=Ascidiaceihabitans sp. TaxID=1872644 RepID=UPI00329681CD
MHANWDDVRLFLSVAREGGLSAAGKILRLDPATLGRRMTRLEDTTGTALFVKSPQGYALTEAGTQLLARAEAAETAMRAATASFPTASESLTGQIRIGAPDGCANYVLPQVCARLSARHPDLDIQIVALPRVFNLSRREADLAIGVSAPTAGRLTVQKITDYKLHLAAAEDYLQASATIRMPQDLKSHKIVGYIPDMIFDRELDYLAHIGVARVPLASNSVSVQLNLLRHGGGVGVVHDFALPAAPNLVRILTDKISLTRAFYMIRHEADRKNTKLTQLADDLSAGLRQEVAHLEATLT